VTTATIGAAVPAGRTTLELMDDVPYVYTPSSSSTAAAAAVRAGELIGRHASETVDMKYRRLVGAP